MSNFRSRIVGAWELVSYTSTNKDNPKDIKYPMTSSALGMIIYTADGYMSAQLQFPDIPPYVGGGFKGTPSEYAESARKTMAYTGPFYLEEVEGSMKQRLYHHMNLSQPPNWLGETQLRMAEMREEDDEQVYLYLGPEKPTDDRGVMRIVKLKWRKVKDNAGAKVPKDVKL